jgi:hypothetical protein
VARWISRLLALGSADPAEQLAVLQLSRRTDDRYRDIPSSTQQQSMDWLSHHAAPPHYVELVRTAGALGDREQADVFGESLPIGLRIG